MQMKRCFSTAVAEKVELNTGPKSEENEENIVHLKRLNRVISPCDSLVFVFYFFVIDANEILLRQSTQWHELLLKRFSAYFPLTRRKKKNNAIKRLSFYERISADKKGENKITKKLPFKDDEIEWTGKANDEQKIRCEWCAKWQRRCSPSLYAHKHLLIKCNLIYFKLSSHSTQLHVMRKCEQILCGKLQWNSALCERRKWENSCTHLLIGWHIHEHVHIPMDRYSIRPIWRLLNLSAEKVKSLKITVHNDEKRLLKTVRTLSVAKNALPTAEKVLSFATDSIDVVSV